MPTFYARSVFFVRDASRALAFYTKELGFTLDWLYEEDDKPHVFQVSLHGFELILNQTEPPTIDRPGHGRAFIGLDSDGYAAFKQHVESTGIKIVNGYWGAPTVAIYDSDQNEIFFWLPDEERQKLEAGSGGVA